VHAEAVLSQHSDVALAPVASTVDEPGSSQLGAEGSAQPEDNPQAVRQQFGPVGSPATSQAQAESAAAGQDMPASSAADAPASQAPAQSAAVPPVADMQALARRIGMASRSPPVNHPVARPSAASSAAAVLAGSAVGAHNAPHPSQAQALSPSTPASTAVSGGAAVPPEIQAIILKLVHFIKVGPSGHVCPHPGPLTGAWHCQGPLLQQTKLLCIRV